MWYFYKSWKPLSVLLGVMALWLLPFQQAWATHFRGAIIYAEPTGKLNEVRFYVFEFWRYSSLGTNFSFLDGNEPNVGDRITPPSEWAVYLGDGNWYGDDPGETFEILGFDANPGEDWVAARAIFVHRYSAAGTYDVVISSCCRISGLRNAADESFIVRSRILVNGTNVSVTTSSGAFVGIGRGNPVTYNLPYTNPDRDQLRFRFATYGESGIPSPPSNMTIDPMTGVITWDNSNPATFPENSLWAVQVIIEEYDPGVDPSQNPPKAWVATDWIFKIGGVGNQLPTCTFNPPSPLTVNLNDPVSILITGDDAVGDADDADANRNTVTISSTSMPPGGTLTPNPAVGPAPQTATFNWTASALGTFNATFTVSDGIITTLCTATINVVQPSTCTPAVIQSEQVVGNQGIATFYSPDGIEQILFTALNNLTVVSVQGTGGESFSGTGMGPYVLDPSSSPPTNVSVVFQQVNSNVPTGTYFAEVSTTCPSEQGGVLVANLDPSVAFELKPERFALEGPLPNPFAGAIALRLQLPEASRVSVAVYDMLGREVAQLAGGEYVAGVHEVRWLASSDLPSGMYVLRVEVTEADGGRRIAHRLVTLMR